MKVQSLSIIVPAYNEESSLEKSVESILDSAKKVAENFQILVVNDGSQDRTKVILDSLAQKHQKIKAIHHSHNKMVGGALLSGLSASTDSHVILIPVDNPLTSQQLENFISAAENADIVVGVREKRTGYKSWVKILSKVYWFFCAAIFQTNLKDFTWISLYDRKKISVLSLKFQGIALWPEILVKASKRKYKLVEIDCPMIARRTGKPTVSKISRIIHFFFETVQLWFHIYFQKW